MSTLITSRRVKRYYACGRGFASERGAARFIAKRNLRNEVAQTFGYTPEPDYDGDFSTAYAWVGSNKSAWRDLYDRMYTEGHWPSAEQWPGQFSDEREAAKEAYKYRLALEVEKVLNESRASSLNLSGGERV